MQVAVQSSQRDLMAVAAFTSACTVTATTCFIQGGFSNNTDCQIILYLVGGASSLLAITGAQKWHRTEVALSGNLSQPQKDILLGKLMCLILGIIGVVSGIVLSVDIGPSSLAAFPIGTGLCLMCIGAAHLGLRSGRHIMRPTTNIIAGDQL